MSHRILVSVGAVIAVILLAAASFACQGWSASSSMQATTWTAPRTVDGQPDLQGVWNFATLTPLERPAHLAGRADLTNEEVAAIEKQAELDADQRFTFSAFVDRPKYAFHKRTSLIVDPPDGRIPPLTPNGQERSRAFSRRLVHTPAGPEDRPIWERCILGWNSGPPMISGGYNANVQIFQTREYVALLNEQVHNARIVPLDGRHGTLRQWAGDSRGRWEGQTLVIDSTNFAPFGTGGLTLFNPSRVTFDENLRLTERFTRVSADTLLYEATIDDPTIWTKPWTISAPMTKTQSPIYEYACHEGNYGMMNLLSGARAGEARGGDEHYCYSFDRDCDEVRKFEPNFKNVNHDVTGSGSITGVVRDTTGAVLAGVTVQADSPALFEKVRTVVTDDQGQYKLPDLRPGTYTVAFSLAGFNTVKREGLEVAAPRLNATANAELPAANRGHSR